MDGEKQQFVYYYQSAWRTADLYYAEDTKILMTSHSPYLMRYLKPSQMYFGLPKNDGLAHFAQVDPSKLKYLYKYAGDMELTFGEYMFDFMLDVENDNKKMEKFFIQE